MPEITMTLNRGKPIAARNDGPEARTAVSIAIDH